MRIGMSLLLGLALLTSVGCTDEPSSVPAPTEVRTTLRFRAFDRAGANITAAARESLIATVRERLRALGEATARLRFTDDGTLAVGLNAVDPTLVDQSRREILRNVQLGIRIRVSPHRENAERIRRDQRGDAYETPPRTAWVASGVGGPDLLVAIPEVDAARRVAELAQEQPIQRAAFDAAQAELRRILLRGVFTAGDLADAKAVHGAAAGGRSIVGLTIRPDRVQAFKEFTTLYLGQPYVVLIDGRVVYTAILVEPLDTQIVLGDPDGFTSGGAERLAESLLRAAYGTILEPLD